MKEMKQTPSYEKSGPSILKMAVKIVGYTMLAAVMSLFVYFSLSMLSNGMLTQTVGYNEYEYTDTDGDGVYETKTLLEHVLFDGDTTYETQKETAQAEDGRRIAREMITQPKNDFCAGMIVAVQVLEQVCMLLLLLGLPAYFVHREGDRDRNLVKHHGMKPDRLRGLKMGLLAAVPSLLVYSLLIVGKCGLLSESVQGVYRFCNICLLPIVNLIMPQAVYPATEIAVWQLIALFALLLLLPIACAVAYYGGYRRWFKPRKKKRA